MINVLFQEKFYYTETIELYLSIVYFTLVRIFMYMVVMFLSKSLVFFQRN